MIYALLKFQDSSFSPLISLYLLCRLLQVIGGKSLSNHICAIILNPYGESTMIESNQGDKSNARNYDDSFAIYVSELESCSSSSSDSKVAENINGHGIVGLMTSQKHMDLPVDELNNASTKRSILILIFFFWNSLHNNALLRAQWHFLVLQWFMDILFFK